MRQTTEESEAGVDYMERACAERSRHQRAHITITLDKTNSEADGHQTNAGLDPPLTSVMGRDCVNFTDFLLVYNNLFLPFTYLSATK